MTKTNIHWKKGRGKLGFMNPLIGQWKALADSPLGQIACTRIFSPTLNGKFILLNAHWEIGDSNYAEHALIGQNEENIHFWSFTSDGKHSNGYLSDGTDVHPDAICFEAEMPQGKARMIYWPDEKNGFYWAVESRNKKGWKRFTYHHYLPVRLSKPDYSVLD
ncbi:MAG: hypothetical protein R2806_18630 [Saprospiraceae bacterium]